MSAPAWVAVAVLGSLGALGRLLLEDFVSARLALAFPVGTLAVNVSGALAIGLLSGVALTGEAGVLVGLATIGSYTTFSTWMLETHGLAEQARLRAAALNILLSAAAGLAAVALGQAIGNLL